MNFADTSGSRSPLTNSHRICRSVDALRAAGVGMGRNEFNGRKKGAPAAGSTRATPRWRVPSAAASNTSSPATSRSASRSAISSRDQEIEIEESGPVNSGVGGVLNLLYGGFVGVDHADARYRVRDRRV